MGIAASSVILNNKSRDYLTGILSPQQQATLGHGAELSTEQTAAVHITFSEAFHVDMLAALGVSVAAVVIVLLGYQRGRTVVAERRQILFQEEMQRRMRMAGTVPGSKSALSG